MSLELLQKANLALSNLISGGGYLAIEQSDRFIQDLIDTPTVLKIARTIPMNGPTMEISAIGFGSRVTRPGAEATALNASDHAVPDIRKVDLATKLYKAQTQMTYEVLEDNIERGTLETSVVKLFTGAISRDMEELILRGDTGSGDAYLATMNGFPQRITTNTVNAATTGNSATTFSNALLALPERFKSDLSRLRFITTPTIEQNYRMAVANRQTALGDGYLTANQPVSVLGVPIIKATFMPAGMAILVDPLNLIVGIQRQVRVESDRDIEKGLLKWVISFRMDIEVETEVACVKVTNIA